MNGRSFRTVLFWLHLAAGVTAGAVILLMCVTGVLLTYERQIYAWYDAGYRSQPAPGATRLPIDALLARARAQIPDAAPASVAVAADPAAAVTVTAGSRTLLLDAYSGQLLGESRAQGARQFMTSVKAWHRWLAAEGQGRASARAITGWSNLLFLFIVGSGVYLWMPRRWTWTHLKPALLFTGVLRGKARDFNWHNVVGFWSAIPLFIVVASAVPMSFPWANSLVYRAAGDRVPTAEPPEGGRGGRGARESGREPRAAAVSFDGLDRLFTRAMQQEPRWRTITLRLPASSRAPLAFAIDRGNGGQPQSRSTLTLARDTGATIAYDTFATQSPGRRVRSILRFAHTGEVLGIGGQTIAGLVTAGGSVLVCTGIALAIRRLAASLARRRSAAAPARVRSVA